MPPDPPPATPPAATPPAATPPAATPPAGTPPAAAWYERSELGLDDDIKQFVAGKHFSDAKTALRSGMEASKLVHERNVMERPNPEKLADWKGWSELGWVEDGSKYQLKAPEKLPNGITYSGELFEHLRKTAHEAKVPLPAAQKIHDAVWSYMLDGVQKLEAQSARERSELETTLRNEWGGDYARKSELARRAIAAFNPTADDTSLTGKLMGEPALVKMFATIAERIGEASLPAEGGGGLAPGLPTTIAATEAEINRLHGDPKFVEALSDPRHPQSQDFRAQRQRLISHLATLKQRAGVPI
jgi:hypothetical protein